MKNSKKTLVIAFILIAMVATMAIGFVGCGGTNLDGVYKINDRYYYSIRINGNTIQEIYKIGESDERIAYETTFAKEKDKLVLAKNLGSIFDITISDTGLKVKGTNLGGNEYTNAYTKVINKK